MTSIALERHYRSLEERFPVESEESYAQLVIPNGNARAPFHRWFHMKASFSADLLDQVLRDADLDARGVGEGGVACTQNLGTGWAARSVRTSNAKEDSS